MSSLDVTTFEKLATIPVPEDGLFCLCDPAYQYDEDSRDNTVVTYWEIKEASVYLAKDDYGNRALIVTNGGEPPAELLNERLTGPFIIQDHVGVDSGRVGLYDWNQKALLKEVPFTYMGDGVYPVALWGKDGSLTAFAVLTDPAYYDLNWSKDEWGKVLGW